MHVTGGKLLQEFKKAFVGSPNVRSSGIVIFLSVIFLWTILTLASLGIAPLFDLDEALYAEAAAEMPQNGAWLLPAANGEPFYDKPALFLYFMNGSFALLGKTAFSARLPSALFTFATALFLCHVGLRISQPRLGAFAALIFTSMLMPAVLAHAAILDAALNFWLTVSVVSFFLWQQEGQLRDAVLSMLAAGVAVSVKGPVGAAIPLIVIVLDRLLARDLFPSLRSFPWRWGIPAFLSGALPWYALVSAVYGFGFLKQFILVENLGRFANAMEGHGGGWYYYLLVLIPSALPWVVWLPWWMKHTIALRKEDGAPDRLSRLSLVWSAAVIILFSISRTKLPHYISSIYPAMALGIAAVWLRQGPTPAWARAASWATIVICLPLALTLMILPTLNTFISGIVTNPRAVAIFSQHISPDFRIPAAGTIIVVCLFVLFLSRRRERPQRLFTTFILFGFMLQFSLIWSLSPWAGRLMQGQVMEIAARIRAYPSTEPVYSLANRPSISFYSGRPYHKAGPDVLEQLASLSAPYLLIAYTNNLAALSHLPLEIIVQENDFVLLRHGHDPERQH